MPKPEIQKLVRYDPCSPELLILKEVSYIYLGILPTYQNSNLIKVSHPIFHLLTPIYPAVKLKYVFLPCCIYVPNTYRLMSLLH